MMFPPNERREHAPGGAILETGVLRGGGDTGPPLSISVIPGLVPGTHRSAAGAGVAARAPLASPVKAAPWVPGTSPGMTVAYVEGNTLLALVGL